MFKTKEQQIHTAIIYVAIPLLFMMAPETTMLQESLFSKEAWLTFLDIVLPYDGKWFFH